MKKLYTLITAVIITVTLFGQTPESFKYQAVLRDASGNARSNANVTIDIAILQGTATGTQVFIETHIVTTNAFGLVNLEIGSKNPSGFQNIDWSAGPYFIKMGVDGTEMGTSQLLSVPYALHAKTAENGFSGDYNDLKNKPSNIDEDKTDDVNLTENQTISGDKTFSNIIVANNGINSNNNNIINVAAPIHSSDAVNKAYVDQLLARIDAIEDLLGIETFLDTRDNHDYKKVSIGNQIWMAENLAYLPSVNSKTLMSYTVPYYYVYGYDGTNVDEAKATSNYQNYGVLYNWTAAMAGLASSNNNPSGVQGVCPSGWHMPSSDEWKELEMFLGMSQSEADKGNWRGTDEGGKLKETGFSHWLSPNTGANDSTGFTALPGGGIGSDSDFHSIGEWAHFWTSTHDINNTDNSIARHVSYNEQRVYNNGHWKSLGYSVRCVKD
jgi:uncharacterized protein (TIGR02145 family)